MDRIRDVKVEVRFGVHASGERCEWTDISPSAVFATHAGFVDISASWTLTCRANSYVRSRWKPHTTSDVDGEGSSGSGRAC